MQTKLGWRVYVQCKEWWLYSYTVIGASGEREALDIIRSVITPGNLKMAAKVATVELDDPPPPPSSTSPRS